MSYATGAMAQETDDTGSADTATTAPTGSADDTSAARTDQGSTQDTTSTDDTTSSGSSKARKGSGYGGRATGPSPLPLLEADPAYPVPGPPVNDELPKDIDAAEPWQPNVICDPVDKPGVEAFGNLIGQTYDRAHYTTSRSCIDQKSDHYDGRALDWPLDAGNPSDRRIGDAVAMWLSANDGEMAKRFGIQSIIWNAHSWRPNGSGWQGYVGQSAHTDHIHFSFTWDGAMMRTSWWTGLALEEVDHGPCAVVAGQYAAIPVGVRTEPCPTGLISAPDTGYTSVRPGGSGEGVSLVQPLLGVKATGVLDEMTREALLVWQDEQGIPQTGVMDQLTYAAAMDRSLPTIPEAGLAVPLEESMTTPYTPYKRAVLEQGSKGPAVELLQEALGIEADGSFGPGTEQALLDFTTKDPLLTASEQTTALLWHQLEQADHPTLPYRSTTVANGDTGPVVVKVQELLGAEADGAFGPNTEKAVRSAQAEADIEVTGVVDGPTWAALDQVATASADKADRPAKDKTTTATKAKVVSGDKDGRGGKVDPSTVRD
ncbi:MAG: peptidoglycan-binding protein [Ornithinimicrobium sp.]